MLPAGAEVKTSAEGTFGFVQLFVRKQTSTTSLKASHPAGETRTGFCLLSRRKPRR